MLPMQTTRNSFKQQLAKIIQEEKGTIAAFIAESASKELDAIAFIKGLCLCGCESGITDQFNSFSKIQDFYDKYAKEIEQLRTHFNIAVPGDAATKNRLIICAIELVAFQLYQAYQKGYYYPFHRLSATNK